MQDSLFPQKAFHHGLIAPTNYLHLIPEDSTFHLVLAGLLKDKKYAEFYRKRKEAGDFIIIDNMAFEHKKPLEVEEYYRLVIDSGITPDVVVAPDYPFEDWKKTVKSTLDFVQNYGKYFDITKTDVMAVPQSEKGDWKGWVKAYSEFSIVDDITFIGMSIMGIPNAFCSMTGTDDISLNRIVASLYMTNNNIVNMNKHHHYLGCSDIRELLVQKEIGIIYSNDSSSAVWHGILGKRFDRSAGGLVDGKSKIPVDFDYEFNPELVDDINFNINYIHDLIKI